ncbi:uncharacterized protein [Lepeophtheirus salmonis]|uniref:uncharacterized protein n=1 Tax=Lepeophtheirus salmonis TaxID=72036 RepID=UPI001AE747BF|nr:uncharacterized protein LOC121116307 [Lepeophtheirus salmonis]
MKMFILELSFIFFLGCNSVHSYKGKVSSYKWAPQYFNRPISMDGNMQDFVSKYPYYGGGDSRMDFAQMRALPSMTTGIRRVKGSFASWTPEWNRMSSLGSKRIVWKRSICSKVGEMCVTKSQIYGSQMISPCCPGSVCSLIEGENFICLKNTGGSSNLYPNGGSLSDGPEDIYDYAD